MKRPRMIFVCYRWGANIIGGAEIHHRRLVHDLIARGHEVEVWTTTGRDIDPVAHWGVEWKEGWKPGFRIEDGVPVRRFPLDRVPRQAIGVACKFIQRAVERQWEEADISAITDGWFANQASTGDGASAVHFLVGWHHVEMSNEGFLARWCGRCGTIALGPDHQPGTLWIGGQAPRKTRFIVRTPDGRGQEREVEGEFEEKFALHRGGVVRVEVPAPWRPLGDHRTLGLYVKSLRWKLDAAETVAEADHWNDVRAMGRAMPELWAELLDRIAAERSERLCKLFDWTRGPRCAALASALKNPPSDCEAIIAANLPWATIPAVVRAAPVPVYAMALWHTDDDYYAWPHYLAACRDARGVLANTPWSSERFFAPRGVNARFVGPGVEPPPPRDDFDPMAWRTAHGIAENELVVLSVSRKSPEKRYDLVVDAVARLRARRIAARMVLIGPDMDCRAMPEHVLYLGRVGDDELDAAYRACDAFALMSDSESFGMVMVEAWMRGKPVVANRQCGPTASLVREGVDGFLANDAAELAESLMKMTEDTTLGARLGTAGKERALIEFTQSAATDRFLALLEE